MQPSRRAAGAGILDRSLDANSKQVSLSSFSFLFSEMVQYCRDRAEQLSDLENKCAASFHHAPAPPPSTPTHTHPNKATRAVVTAPHPMHRQGTARARPLSLASQRPLPGIARLEELGYRVGSRSLELCTFRFARAPHTASSMP